MSIARLTFPSRLELKSLAQGDFVHMAPETRRKFVTREEAATLLALSGTAGKP